MLRSEVPSFNVEVSNFASNSASAFALMGQGGTGGSVVLASPIHNEKTLSPYKSPYKAAEGSVIAVTPAKRKLVQGHKDMIEDEVLIKRLILEEMEKMRNVRNDSDGEHLLRPLLENARITSLSNETSWTVQLRLFYFTIGSGQSLLDFKEILGNARKMPRPSSTIFERCRTCEESYRMICRLRKTESLCVLLRRCHTVKLFETELADLAQRTFAMNVETPSTFGTKQGFEAGNPANKRKATITDTVMRKIVPQVEKGTKEYGKHRRDISTLRRLAQPLHLLTERFGFAILALIPSGPNSELEVSDKMQVTFL